MDDYVQLAARTDSGFSNICPLSQMHTNSSKKSTVTLMQGHVAAGDKTTVHAGTSKVSVSIEKLGLSVECE